MRKSIEITGIIDESVNLENIKMLLEAAGISDGNIKTISQYDDWLANLSKKSIKGLKDACLDWIRYWGSGGGDQSSEDCITDTIEQLKSNVPAKLANAIYNSIVDYTKTEFDAAQLTIEMIDGSIEDIEQAGDDE